MNNQSVVIGGGALVLGLILGVAVSGARVDGKVAQAMSKMDEFAETADAAQQEALSAIDTRFGALEAQISEATDATAALGDDVGAQMTEMQQGLVAQIEAVTASAEAKVATLRDELAAAASEAAEVETTAAEPAPTVDIAVPAPPVDMAVAATRSVGETAVLAEGALRVFVSRLDADAGMARLSINGSDTTLALGEATTVSLESGDCAVSVISIGADGAALASDCGVVPVADAPVTTDVPPAPAEGFRPGEVAILADGDLRVFVSGLAADNSTARLAINGLALETVSSGGSIAVASGDKSCTVSVTGVGNGLVGLDGSCG